MSKKHKIDASFMCWIENSIRSKFIIVDRVSEASKRDYFRIIATGVNYIAVLSRIEMEKSKNLMLDV